MWSVFNIGLGYTLVLFLLDKIVLLPSVPEKYCWAKSNDSLPIFSPIILPLISSIGGCIPPQILDKLVWSEASWKVAHWRVKDSEGPSSKTKNSFFNTSNVPSPPGKNSLPVIFVKDTAAALEKAEWPDK